MAIRETREVVDRYADGRPHHVRVKVRVLGRADTESLEYHWGPDWLVWDAEPTSQQYAQHGEYRLVGEHDGQAPACVSRSPSSRSRRFRRFLVKRAVGAVVDAATAGLRQLALSRNP